MTADEILVDADRGTPAAAPAIDAEQVTAPIPPELRDLEPKRRRRGWNSKYPGAGAASLSGVDNRLVLELELSCRLHEVLGCVAVSYGFHLGQGTFR